MINFIYDLFRFVLASFVVLMSLYFVVSFVVMVIIKVTDEEK